jgi:hypothetical protein
MGPTSNNLGATMAVLVVFSIFCQQSAGLSFGIVPFVSKRSTGLVSGFVGSGGNVGGAVTQVGTPHRWWLLLLLLLLLLLYSIGPSIIVRGPVALALLFDRHAACWRPQALPKMQHWVADHHDRFPPCCQELLLTICGCCCCCCACRNAEMLCRRCSSPTPGYPPPMASSGWE